MPHVPHLYIPGPWEGAELGLPAPTAQHLRRVLRRADGSPVTYTDGSGTVGEGMLHGPSVRRGREHHEPAPAAAVCLAVAPPKSTDRARFLVEKLAELGVDRLIWVRARHSQAGPPGAAKVKAWAIAGLEQSRGAHLLAVEGPVPPADLAGPLWVADPDGDPPPAVLEGPVTVLVGPEGGLAPGEAPAPARPVGLGMRVLRTETAAVAAALVALQASGRFPTPRRSPRNPSNPRTR